ncbi:carbonic anhydrase-like [Dermacentor variabilis]|uniref:carbonic anhydrase-like n=1 Tax=Dermacentor variabilis TaxID=34621 RepID=UPI003F5B454B
MQRCWSYDNDGTWSWPQYHCIANNSCGGTQQSPVNIETFSALHDVAMKALEFEGHGVPFENFTVNNDGLSLTLKAAPPDATTRTVRGGRLPGKFVFRYALFHWGSSSHQGSEHLVDGIAYPMEVSSNARIAYPMEVSSNARITYPMEVSSNARTAYPMESQLVYTNEKYSATDAAKEHDGVAIIATLYRVTFVDFESVKAMRSILAALNSGAQSKRRRRRLLPWMVRRLTGRGDSSSGDADTHVPRLTLDSLMPSVGRDEFFTYRGSLTMPPCTESVSWTVFNRQAFVTESLLQKLRRLKDRTGVKPLMDNFRPPQKLNDRRIISSFPPF